MLKLIRSAILGAITLWGPCSCIAPGTTWELNAGFHADVTSTPPDLATGVDHAHFQAPKTSPTSKATREVLEAGRSCCSP